MTGSEENSEFLKFPRIPEMKSTDTGLALIDFLLPRFVCTQTEA